MEKLEVKVRWDDILFGRRKEPNTCAIARAIKRVTGKEKVSVQPYNISVTNGEFKVYQVSPELKKFIKSFDKHRFSVRPQTFILKRE